jgi:hypothetical protein
MPANENVIGSPYFRRGSEEKSSKRVHLGEPYTQFESGLDVAGLRPIDRNQTATDSTLISRRELFLST